MNTDLETQIRLLADEALAQTTAVEVDRRPDVSTNSVGPPTTNKEQIMLKSNPEPPRSSRRTRVLAIAASVAVIVVGLVAIALLRGDSDQTPVDPPTPATVVDESAALAAVGEQLVAAFDAHDRDAVAELVADNANPVSMIGVTTKEGLIDLVGYFEAADLGFLAKDCTGTAPDQVDCTVLQTSRFATAAQVGAGSATLLLKVVDGEVVGMRYGRPERHGRAHDLFSAFIRDIDPDAPAKMWWSNSDGEPFPRLTDEALELIERYTKEFAESRG